MRFNFIRPATKAIKDVTELTVGTKIYHFYGIYPPQVDDTEYTVSRAPTEFQNYSDFEPHHLSMGNELVFEVTYPSIFHEGQLATRQNFCSDGNIGRSTNRNYWFKTLEDAEEYCLQCHEDYKNNPSETARIKEERELDRLCDLHDLDN